MLRSVFSMEKVAHLALGAIWSFPAASETLKLFGALIALKAMALCTSRKLALIKNMDDRFYFHGQPLTLTRHAFIFVKCILVLGESRKSYYVTPLSSFLPRPCFKVAPGLASAIPAAA